MKKIAYVSIKNAKQLGKGTDWSGTSYYIAQSIKSHDTSLDYLGPLEDKLLPHAYRKLKRHYYQLRQEVYLKDTDPLTLRSYASQVSKMLSSLPRHDVVLSATTNPIAYLNCKQPILFWADATFRNTSEFYPKYSHLCQETISQGHKMEELAIEKCKFAIYSSDWAAQTAISFYGAKPEKVKVVPFGANLESNLDLAEVKALIESRPESKCKLIFIGVDWIRKGGEKALDIAKALNESGLSTELTLVGSQPSSDVPLPNFVKPLGYISKLSKVGQEKLSKLIGESHFLILPTLADCSPIVMCEANAFGVPCLSTDVGGIPTIIPPGVGNGKLFNAEASSKEYCEYIVNTFLNYSTYKDMALASYNEYKMRLNWQVAGESLRELLNQAIAQ